MKSARARFVICCFTLLGLWFSAAYPESESRRPNVLLISLDTLRADHLGCYGYSRATSPFLDEIAARGLLFRNAFVNCHSTPQSHTTILSSQYQETHTVGMYRTPLERLKDADLSEEKWIDAIPESVSLVQEVLQRHDYLTLAVTGGAYISEDFGFSRGFDEFVVRDEIADATAKVLEMLRRPQAKSRPLFLFLHTYQIHSPYAPPPRYRTLFGSFESDFEATTENLLKIYENASALSAEEIRYLEAMYDGEIRQTDDALRDLFAELERVGFLKNALVIVTSDHGDEFGEHGGLLHGPKLYDELIRVPLILFGRGVPEGEQVDRLVSSVDIVPTILAHAGIERDASRAGRDLLTLSPRPSKHDMVFSQLERFQYSVRTLEWKLILQAIPTETTELYDLRNDPGEKINVASRFPKRVRRMKRALASWKEEMQAVARSGSESEVSDEELERLRALGYVK